MICAAATTSLNPFRDVSDDDLLFQTQLAVRGERSMTIRVLHQLNENDRRKLYLERGYRSLFDYCIRKLKYSPSAAGRRIQAARCIRRYPEVLALFHEGALSLCAVSLVAPVLTDENKTAILERVAGRSHRAIERIVCEYREPARFRDSVRPLPAPEAMDADRVLFERELVRLAPHAAGAAGDVPAAVASVDVAPAVGAGAFAGDASAREAVAASAGSVGTSADPAATTPNVGSGAAEHRFLVKFVANEALMGKLEAARSLVSHRCKDGAFADVLGIVLDDYLERHSPEARHRRRQARKKKACAENRNHSQRRECNTDHSQRRECETNHSQRRESRSVRGSRHIPAAVRDEVFVRDGGRCTFVASDGTRCGATRSLQVDHIRPFAAGGAHEPSNLRLLCAAHNRLAAEHTLGKHIMRPWWRRE